MGKILAEFYGTAARSGTTEAAKRGSGPQVPPRSCFGRARAGGVSGRARAGGVMITHETPR